MTEPVDMADLLGLEWRGVKVVVKKQGTMDMRVAGVYSFFWRRISLNGEIIPYWFTTLMTLLHEYAHHRQKWFLVGCLILATVPGLSLWTYSRMVPSLLVNSLTILLGVGEVIVGALLKVTYFEAIADRYARERVPSIILFLSDLEVVEFVEKLQDGRVYLQRELGRFYRNIKEYNPQLLD